MSRANRRASRTSGTRSCVCLIGVALNGCGYEPLAKLPLNTVDAADADGRTAADARNAADAPADSAPLDDGMPAPASPALIAANAPLRIAINDTVPIGVEISAAAQTSLDWSIASGGGTFQPSTGRITTTSEGIATISLEYTAAASTGDRTHDLAVDGAKIASFATRVRSLTAAGQQIPYPDNAGLAVNPDILIGQQVFVPSDVVIMRLAVVAQTGGYGGRMALYTNVGGLPGDLVVGTSLATVVVGPNERAVLPTQVAMGTYWIMANFNAAAPIKRNADVVTGQAYMTLPTTSPLPATASTQAVTNRTMNYYLLFAN